MSQRAFSDDLLGGKRVLVSGASSGIGRATARVLARHGARVVLCARREAELQNTRDHLPGDDHTLLPLDLSELDGIDAAIEACVADGGKLDGLVHAAGTLRIKPLRMLEADDCRDMLQVGALAGLMLARSLTKKRHFAAEGGSLVFVSSVAATTGTAGLAGYGAAKAAVVGYSRSLAVELAPRAIRANTILAGAVETEMHQGVVGGMTDEAVADYRSRHPLGFGSPEDVAMAALYLLSDAARWVTGSELTVDGGYTAR